MKVTMADAVNGFRRLTFDEKQPLKDHEFRGKELFHVEFENAGTLIFQLDDDECAAIARAIADDKRPKITLTIESSDG